MAWLDVNLTFESLSNVLRESTKGFFIFRGVPELLGLDIGRQQLLPNLG